MHPLALLLTAASLGLNNLAASIAIGLSGVDRATRARVALAFAAFEAGMPIVGLVIGHQLSHTLGSAAHIVGGLLLIAAGGQIMVAAARAWGEATSVLAGARLGRLLLLSAGLSLDNLVVGFALGAYRTPLVLSVAIIAGVSVGLSLLGLELGARLGARFERRSAVLSGVVLMLVGVAVLTKLL